jgi:tetratricopeptide (TPR) repeat protein
MTPDEAAFLEEQFPLLLAAADEALAAGEPGSFIQAAVPEELRPRLEREVVLCRMVRELLPKAKAAAPSSGAYATQAESEPATEGGRLPAGLPTRVGRFQIHRELGRGSFGVVFQAYDPRLGREVALKVPHPELMLCPTIRARFRQEARAAATLDHPNLVPVYEAGEENGDCYIASAYCPGANLAAWLRQRTERVPYQMAARIVAALAGAVEHAHRRGVLHRDLKPANVMLEMAEGSSSADGVFGFVPRVTDFGLAKLLDETAALEAPGSLTQSGVILGTPNYMAPEQAEGNSKALGPTADVYALGVILYELLTGRPPFQADTPLSTLLLVRQCEPLSPARLRPSLPRDLETICLKCLQKEPRRRYTSAAALEEDLRRYLAGEPILARRTGPLFRLALWCRRKPGLASTIAIATLAIVVVTLFSFVRVMHERDRAELRRREAVANLKTAREAVDRMLTRVSEERLRDIPQVEPVQRALLEDALEFYAGFARQAHDDPEVLLEASQAYGRLGRTYDALGRTDDAEGCLRQARAIQERLVAAFPAVAIYRRELALSIAELAGVWGETGRSSESLDAFRQVLAMLEQLAAADPAEPLYRVRQAVVHETRGIILARMGQSREAESEMRTAIDIADELAARFPDEPSHRSRAAVSRSNLAGTLAAQGQLDEGIRVLLRNLEFWEKLAAADPATSNNRSKLALTLTNLADLWSRSGRKGEAERALRRVVDLRRALATDFPNSPGFFGRLADAGSHLAVLAADRGDLGEARRLQEQAVTARRTALSLTPKNADFQKSASAAYAALIETLIRLRDHEAASKVVAEFVALFPVAGPQCSQAASFLAQCVPLAAADERLTKSRRELTAAAYSSRAIELLRESAKNGHRDLEALTNDRSFDPLRSRAEFRELLAVARQTQAATSDRQTDRHWGRSDE